ncbi:hypothetical protein [uncultured Maritalea sp.]|jgi:hypothetical protein|uniref:hypothetical protein n=1 Tax=uncultured Maritalea sp. TaxID=757249 RepID=UPI0026051509|nr:hypothetical protein [uncultured Maritalea sp.]
MRIIWFGKRCFRVKFSDKEFVFYPEDAMAHVSANELVGMAIVITENQVSPFQPLMNAEPKMSGGRLIDVMDEPESYLASAGIFVLDALPDERLVIQFLGNEPNREFEAWIDGAVALCAGTYQQCLGALEGLVGKGVRQVLIAISDMENIDVDEIAAKAGGARIQLLEPSLAIEL